MEARLRSATNSQLHFLEANSTCCTAAHHLSKVKMESVSVDRHLRAGTVLWIVTNFRRIC